MSRPQVTITLGRSGQVVKRAGNSLNDSRAAPPLPKSGSKRSLKERLGGKADNLLHGSFKRRRAESDIKGLNGAGDLRIKLMQRNKTRQASGNVGRQDHINPHVNIPRTVHSPMSSYTHTLEPKLDSPLRRIPPTRSAEDLFELNSMRKPYSSWTHDGLQHESPDRIFRVSGGFSPPRPINGQRELLAYRPIDAPRVPTQVIRDVYDHAVAGPRSSSHFVTRTPLPLDSARSLPRLHTQGAISHRSVYAVQGQLTVGAFLNSLGLGKYAIHFQAEEVDMDVLKQMRDHDLKEMGIPMGPRRKILLALLSRSRRV
ncbi:uncharacterized protein LOC115734677 isoform X1 [Rhodamnia argentea]|uniref:Uncharacterized protein LOC115734677 isoform X1 n=1 Tax=Rhodamnia argentea TaxID=178133 RepID=A0A8B8NGY2_9MYRT|nr:uncharacterized protein LOC115734677 isoform X1 [Rhodamnia argentea]